MTDVGVRPQGDPVDVEVVDLLDGSALDFVNQYTGGGGTSDPLSQLVGHAVSAGARKILIEPRYTDQDFRSEHSGHYVSTFPTHAPLTHRAHFFGGEVPGTRAELTQGVDAPYLGYCVLRPVKHAAVGRTLLHPGLPGSALEHLAQDATMCASRQLVNLLGVDYEAIGVPYMSQDGQLGRCAHTVTWQAAFHHHLAFGSGRLTPGHVAMAAPELGAGRTRPSAGLLYPQLAATMSQVGLQPLIYDCSGLRGETAASIAIRYLDSNLPVIGVRGAHTVLVVGYRRHDKRLFRSPRHTFVEHDDMRGPYRDDAGSDWSRLIVATPPELYLTGEEAERIARSHLLSVVGEPPPDAANGDETRRVRHEHLLEDLRRRTVRVTTVAVRSNQFKRTLSARGMSPAVAAGYRQIPLPLWIWVVELANADDPDEVIAEVLVDATSSSASRPPPVLAWRVWNDVQHADVDSGKVGGFVAADQDRGVLALREFERRQRYAVAPPTAVSAAPTGAA